MGSSQGQGADGTPWKGIGLRMMLEVSFRISHKLAAWHYNYISLNSGSGWNEKAQCDGDAVEFLKSARRNRRKFRAFLVEIDEARRKILKSNIKKHNTLRYPIMYGKDNTKALPRIADSIRSKENPNYAIGMLFCDPNGPSPKNGFPHEGIIQFAQEFKRIDICLNINVSKIKGLRTVVRSPKMTLNSQRKWIETVSHQVLTLDGIMNSINKKHWLIREPVLSSGYYYIMLVGVNYDKPTAWKQFGFYPRDSMRGKIILDEADQDKTNRRNQK